jgi:hypothetical protein
MRRMFVRCAYTTKLATAIPSRRTGSLGSVSTSATMSVPAAAMEASDTMRHTPSTASQTRSARSTAFGASARKTPAAVATPFPPRKRM